MCKILTVSVQNHTFGVCKSFTFMQIMRKFALFFGKIYTAGTNFTRLPVVTVATNLNSVSVCGFTLHMIDRPGKFKSRHGYLMAIFPVQSSQEAKIRNADKHLISKRLKNTVRASE